MYTVRRIPKIDIAQRSRGHHGLVVTTSFVAIIVAMTTAVSVTVVLLHVGFVEPGDNQCRNGVLPALGNKVVATPVFRAPHFAIVSPNFVSI